MRLMGTKNSCKILYEDTRPIAQSVGSSFTQQPVTELNREVTNNIFRTEVHCMPLLYSRVLSSGELNPHCGPQLRAYF